MVLVYNNSHIIITCYAVFNNAVDATWFCDPPYSLKMRDGMEEYNIDIICE